MRCSLCSGETETSYYKGMINSTCGKQGQLPESEGRKRMKRNLPSELGWSRERMVRLGTENSKMLLLQNAWYAR